MKRRDFVKGCIYCSCLGLLSAGGLFSYNLAENRYEVSKDSKFYKVDIHLVEHCNLNCKYCCHFSSIAKEEYYDINEYEQDIKRLSEITNGKLKEICLMGGEPLLHPQINKLLELTRKYFPDACIELITNAVLLNSRDSVFWKTLKDNNILLFPTLYPINLKWDKVFENVRKYNIDFVAYYNGKKRKITPQNIEKYKIKEFFKLQLDFQGQQPTDNNCFARWNCTFFGHGKIYPCFVPSNIRHFNSYFNKNIEVTENDYIDIYKVKSFDEIYKFLDGPFPICRYCKDLADIYLPWEVSKNKHSIDEWH